MAEVRSPAAARSLYRQLTWENGGGPLFPCQTPDGHLLPVFFPEEPGYEDKAAQAKALCGGCPARLPCLAGARERHERHGIWGSVDFAAERRRKYREAPRAARARLPTPPPQPKPRRKAGVPKPLDIDARRPRAGRIEREPVRIVPRRAS